MPERIAAKVRAARGRVEGERKLVTVLFADVQGSMDLSGTVDAEQWWGVIDRFFGLLCECVHRFDGHVDRFTGDGIMAVFGAPVALEDHAVRACHAALEIREALRAYAEQLRRESGLAFAVRIGVHSGEVVVGTIGDDLSVEYAAIGRTAGLAQRMEALAAPGSVCLTARTASLVEGFFALRELGATHVKGVQEPVGVFELVGAGALRTPLERSAARGFSRFVGRQRELAALESARARAFAGDGRVVAVVGEAGVGKSRLCHEFLERCRREGTPVWRAHALAHARDVPFVAALAMLRDYFAISEHDDPSRARERIAERMLALDERLADEVPVLFDFLGVGDPERAAERLDPQARHRRLRAVAHRMVAAQSQQAPGVMLVEDLHWLDPGSEAFLENLIDGLPSTRALVLVTFRPGYHAGWLAHPHCTRLPLPTLDDDAATLLLGELLGSDRSLDGLAEVVRQRTGGNPFFIEEVVRSLAETGTLHGAPGAYRLAHTIQNITIPASLEAVLAARIDRLTEPAKDTLQLAAVIGRSFGERLLARVSDLPVEELGAALRALVDAELISTRSTSPQSEYRFGHALTEHVAYHSQLTPRRRAVHAAVAQAIADVHPDHLDEQAALIAHHYELGDKPLQAAHWAARAAAWAGYSDPREAVRHWHKAKQLSDIAPPSPEQAALAVGARVMLVNFAWRLGVAENQTAREFERETSQLFDEATRLAEAIGDIVQLATLRLAYGGVLCIAGHPEESLALVVKSIGLADRTGDLGLRVAFRAGILYPLFVLGRYGQALALADEALALVGDDPAAVGTGWLVSPYAELLQLQALVRAIAGGLVEARSGLERAVEIARAHGDVETQSWGLGARAVTAELGGGDGDVALTDALQGIELAERTGGAYHRGLAQFCAGTARVLRREWPEAIAAIERGLAIWRSRQVGLDLEPWARAYLSQAQLGAGDGERARASAELAVALARERGTRTWELHARLALAQALRSHDGASATGAIESELGRALELIEQTGARTFEPRVRLELAELARLRGDEDECERELREAQRLFVTIGAPALAARVPLAVS